MSLLRILLALVLGVALQTALGRLWPDSSRYVDVLLVPVVWYGLSGNRRTGMLVGCSAGLLRDAWFEIGTFGLNGFKRTLLGWVLGGLGSRFDLNHQPGRLMAGFMTSLADSTMDTGLRRLLDQQQSVQWSWSVLVKALVTALLVAGAYELMERLRLRRVRRHRIA